jgi:HD-GYP domain-containing protein (c-di-GMP phosphodiesterase class II)
VLSVVADMQPAWDRAAAADTSYSIFALDPTGRIFATSNAEKMPLDADLSETDLVQSFQHSAGLDFRSVPYTWSRNGREDEYIGTWLKTQQGWGVFVQAGSRQVYWPVQNMVRTTRMWAALALISALIAAVLMARRLTRPIRRLASASRQFAAGNFSTRVPVRTRNEIGELADTFNLMASEIQEYIRELQELFSDTINALTAAIDAKDPYTHGHSERVNEYAVIIARYMSLTPEQAREINIASRLHDVGKIAIRDSVLGKQGPLTAEEFEEMKSHTVRGEAIMAPIRQMRAILPGLRNHHERWAGGGYPDGLKGEAIPRMARIIAVADTFDATTTERPYQRAMTFEQAKNRINELRGTGLDPEVVDAFNRAFDAGEFRKPAREPAPVPVSVLTGPARSRRGAASARPPAGRRAASA